LQYVGYSVTKVQNITDVGHLTNDDLADADGDDKVAKKAKQTGQTAWDIAHFYTQAYIEDEKALRILPPDHRPKATDYIDQQIAMTQTLIEKGFAYEAKDSVYFRTAKFEDYGKLSKNKLEDLKAGARVEINDEKEDPLDFALWKQADQNHLMQWDSPWGKGFPGWHIECSAMSQTLLPHTDIHTGGEDNAFPHHECEIAQNECSHNYTIPVWLHAKHLLVDSQKMSKSKGNFFTIRDLLAQGYTGAEIRYALLAAHYRTALNFTEDSLTQARNSIARIQEAHRLLETVCDPEPEVTKNRESDLVDQARQKFKQALTDDLNVAEALAAVFDLIAQGLQARDQKKLNPDEALLMVEFLEQDFNRVFAVLSFEANQLPTEVEALLQKRAEARLNKDFATSDKIRDEIKALGWEVKDEADGQTLKPL
jgi:cysteinyl-tRNA synthetase